MRLASVEENIKEKECCHSTAGSVGHAKEMKIFFYSIKRKDEESHFSALKQIYGQGGQ